MHDFTHGDLAKKWIGFAIDGCSKKWLALTSSVFFIQKLHSVFFMSAKNQRQLKYVDSNLYKNEQVTKIGAIFTVGRAAFSLGIIREVWNSYNAFATWLLKQALMKANLL